MNPQIYLAARLARDLRDDDWLEIEIAVKLVRLQRASAVDTDTP